MAKARSRAVQGCRQAHPGPAAHRRAKRSPARRPRRHQHLSPRPVRPARRPLHAARGLRAPHRRPPQARRASRSAHPAGSGVAQSQPQLRRQRALGPPLRRARRHPVRHCLVSRGAAQRPAQCRCPKAPAGHPRAQRRHQRSPGRVRAADRAVPRRLTRLPRAGRAARAPGSARQSPGHLEASGDAVSG